MKLRQFYNKKVNIVSKEGTAFSGVVTEYFYPEENESGKESIVIDSSSGAPVEFYEEDIKIIENVVWEASCSSRVLFML